MGRQPKGIDLFTKQGVKDTSYKSLKECAEALGVTEQSVFRAIKKKGTVKGFQARYSSDNIESLPEFINGRYKGINQLDLEGNFIKRFDTMTEAAEEMGVALVSIWNAVDGKTKTSAGSKWEYAKD